MKEYLAVFHTFALMQNRPEQFVHFFAVDNSDLGLSVHHIHTYRRLLVKDIRLNVH
jgi:hypothetical protein